MVIYVYGATSIVQVGEVVDSPTPVRVGEKIPIFRLAGGLLPLMTMGLSELPTEILLMIASCLSQESHINALIRTNRRLYRELHQVLPFFNAQYLHAFALFFAVEHHLPRNVQHLLEGLNVARARPHCLPNDLYRENRIAKRLRKAENRQSKDESESESEEEEDSYFSSYNLCYTLEGRRRNEHSSSECKDSYWEDIYAHPLSSRGYCISVIENLQHALILAIQRDRVDIVNLLLQFGAEPNFYRGRGRVYPPPKNRIGWESRPPRGPGPKQDLPPLFTAVRGGSLEMVKLLLDSGADPQRYDLSNLYRAVEDQRRDIISALIKLDVRSQRAVLKLAALRNDCGLVEFLIDEGLNVAEQGHVGLYVAEMKGYEDIARLLRLRGATLFALSGDDKMDWEEEDRDGTYRRRSICCFASIDDEVLEDEDEEDEVPED